MNFMWFGMFRSVDRNVRLCMLQILRLCCCTNNSAHIKNSIVKPIGMSAATETGKSIYERTERATTTQFSCKNSFWEKIKWYRGPVHSLSHRVPTAVTMAILSAAAGERASDGDNGNRTPPVRCHEKIYISFSMFMFMPHTLTLHHSVRSASRSGRIDFGFGLRARAPVCVYCVSVCVFAFLLLDRKLLQFSSAQCTRTLHSDH